MKDEFDMRSSTMASSTELRKKKSVRILIPCLKKSQSQGKMELFEMNDNSFTFMTAEGQQEKESESVFNLATPLDLKETPLRTY